MLRIPEIQRFRQKSLLFAASSFLLLTSTQGLAQSGRRTSKPPQIPNDLPRSNDGNPTPARSTRELKNKVTLLVGRQPSSKHLLSEDAIFSFFLNHLSEMNNVSVTPLGDIKHDALVKRAKKETEAIVVLVEFDVDDFQSGTIILNSPDLDVKVTTFMPVTGQKKFQGKVYYKAVGGPMLKKDNWPTGTPIRITTEGVGVEAAEQVRDWLFVRELKKKH